MKRLKTKLFEIENEILVKVWRKICDTSLNYTQSQELAAANATILLASAKSLATAN